MLSVSSMCCCTVCSLQTIHLWLLGLDDHLQVVFPAEEERTCGTALSASVELFIAFKCLQNPYMTSQDAASVAADMRPEQAGGPLQPQLTIRVVDPARLRCHMKHRLLWLSWKRLCQLYHHFYARGRNCCHCSATLFVPRRMVNATQAARKQPVEGV